MTPLPFFGRVSWRLPGCPRLHIDDNRLFLAVFQLAMQLTPGAPHTEAGSQDVLAERPLHTTIWPSME